MNIRRFTTGLVAERVRPESPKGRRRRQVHTLRAVFVAVVSVAGVLSAGVPGASGAGRGWTARSAVLASYSAEFMRLQPPSGWSGDVSRCQAGSTSEAFKRSVLQRVNWYREIAGLSPVEYDPAGDQSAQLAALIQSASGYLSHSPSPSQPCWTSQGQGGSGRSNLALGTHGVRAIDSYMQDGGESNTAAGHRWWILSPKLGGITFGDVPVARGNAANAMWVSTTSSAVTPRDGFVAWPAQGSFPDAIAPVRWSFDANLAGDSYTNANVTVTGPQGPVAVRVVHRDSWLVWEMPVTMDVSADTTYTVKISGVSADGVLVTDRTYNVTLVDTNRAPAMTATIGYGRTTCVTVDTVVAGGMFQDDGDATLFASLVSGDGDDDNERFSVTVRADGAVLLTAAQALPLNQVEYSVRVVVADADGARSENVIVFDVIDATLSDQPCPARNVSASQSRSGWAKVTWDPPIAGPEVTYSVVRDGVVVCSSPTTSCEGYFGAGIHTLQVVSMSEKGVATYSLRASVTVSENTQPSKPGVAGGSRVKVATLLKLPAGTRSWVVRGPCALSRDKVWVRFGTRSGVCSLTVTGKRKVGGRTVTKSVSKRITVRWPA